MTINIYTPSEDWPTNYNYNMDQVDGMDMNEMYDATNVSDYPYDHAVLEYDSGTSMWVDSGVLTGTLEVVYGVWDSTCKDAGATLSRNDRVLYCGTTYDGARATIGSDTVYKYYFEISNYNCNTRCNSSYFRCGVGYVTNCSDPVNNKNIWEYRGDGYLYDNTGTQAASGLETVGQGDYIGFAVEVIGTTCKVWVRQPSGDWHSGDPETGTSPSFQFDTGGNEISPFGHGAWVTYIELVTKDDYFEFTRPSGFYELRTNNFSTTTTSTTTTTTTTSTTTTTTTITFTTTSTTTTTGGSSEEGFDTAISTADYTYTNNNETIENDVYETNHSAISEWSASSGKYYFEFHMGGATEYSVNGICRVDGGASFSSTDRLGFTSDSWGLMDYPPSGIRVYHNSSYDLQSVELGDSGVLGVAVDITNGDLWFAVDNVWVDDPSNNVGDPANGNYPAYNNITGTIAAASSVRDVGDTLTLVLNGDNMTYAPPSGFSVPFGTAQTTTTTTT